MIRGLFQGTWKEEYEIRNHYRWHIEDPTAFVAHNHLHDLRVIRHEHWYSKPDDLSAVNDSNLLIHITQYEDFRKQKLKKNHFLTNHELSLSELRFAVVCLIIAAAEKLGKLKDKKTFFDQTFSFTLEEGE